MNDAKRQLEDEIICPTPETEDVDRESRVFVISAGAFYTLTQQLDANALDTNERLKALMARPKRWV